MKKLLKFSKNQAIALLVGVVVLVVGLALVMTRAAGTFASFEAENGTLSGGVAVINDGTASGGKAIKFAPSTSTPTPPPTTGACTGAANTPDGPDAFGGCFPGPNNTGVPAGVTLTNYTGPCTITAANTVIDGKLINNCDRFDIGPNATGVIIKNSKVTTTVYNNDLDSYHGSVTIQDSEVDATGQSYGAVTYKNITIVRSDVMGGQHNVLCSSNCHIYDSYLHNPYVFDASHNNGFLSNGGNDYIIEHSTVSCDVPKNSGGGGCSGDISLFGDFGPISDVTVNKSLLTSNLDLAYCFYGGYQTNKPYGTQTRNVVFTNNVVQRGSNNKCGAFGAVTNFNTDGGGPAPGNVWTNNKWSDGAILNS